MQEDIGKALWEIYEDAVASQAKKSDSGLAKATLKFIQAFETELADARLDLYTSTSLKHHGANSSKTEPR